MVVRNLNIASPTSLSQWEIATESWFALQQSWQHVDHRDNNASEAVLSSTVSVRGFLRVDLFSEARSMGIVASMCTRPRYVFDVSTSMREAHWSGYVIRDKAAFRCPPCLLFHEQCCATAHASHAEELSSQVYLHSSQRQMTAQARIWAIWQRLVIHSSYDASSPRSPFLRPIFTASFMTINNCPRHTIWSVPSNSNLTAFVSSLLPSSCSLQIQTHNGGSSEIFVSSQR